ncbi:MAG: conjugal transfer protein [Gemmatimonadetes bacterium]|nr:conjugal transfer protein [Gemmatimonadota bacterium]
MAVNSTRAAPESTYLRARDAFLNVFSDPVRGRRNWQLAAFGLLLVNAFLAVSYQRLASTAQWTPYIVKVDRFGQVVYSGPAEKTNPADPNLVAYTLRQFIGNVRRVSSDPAAQMEFINGAYAHLAKNAARYVNQHFSDPANDPRVLGRSVSRTVTVNSALPIPKSNTWKVQWTEEDLPLQGGGAATRSSWEAYLTVEIVPPPQPTTDAEWDKFYKNPLGLYVVEINWTPISTGEAKP